MSIETNTPRLLAAAKEFNIGKDTLLEFLERKGFDTKSFKPNTKLSEEMYDALQEEYASDKAVKRKSEKIALPKVTLPDNINNATAPEVAVSIKEQEVPVANEKENPKSVVTEKKPVTEISVSQESVSITNDLPVTEEKKDAEKPADIIPEVQKEAPQETKTGKKKKEAIAKEETEKETKAAEQAEETIVIAKEEIASEEENEVTSVQEGTAEESAEEEQEHIDTKVPKLEGPKVLAKINLENLNLSTRPKKGVNKKPEPKPVSSTKGVTKTLHKKTTPEPQRTERKEDRPKETEQQPKRPVSSNNEAEATVIHIETNAPKLEGPRVIGKIELPVHPARNKNDNLNKEKKKRKRIPVDKQHSNPRPGGGDFASRGNIHRNKGKDRFDNKRNGNNSNLPQEIDAKEIQEKIKETQAKLAGGGTRSKNLKAKYRRNKREERAEKRAAEELSNEGKIIRVTEFISVSELANLLDVSFAEVISKCMSLGIMVSINQRLDAEVIELVSSEFDTEVEFINLEDKHEEEEEEELDNEADLEPRAPVITIMGHVDHGKTSLLDYIRNSSVVAGEEGGITQHIGAYKVVSASGKELTFLDTPGHEAFTAMRARGAKAADVAIIVIAADDAVMPQTREAISHAQAANLPMVFAINKIDKDGANPDKIKEQLSTMNILVEDWGGNYQCQEISAKKGLNIDTLLEKVVLEAELLELKANPNRNAIGTIIEASLDKGRGYVSTVLVQAGTLKQGDMIVTGQYYGKVRAMANERGQKVVEAGPSTPVQVLGLNGAPQAGEKFKVYLDESEGKALANHRSQILREQGLRSRKHITLDEIGRRLALGNFKELNVIIKADFDGSAEALSDSLQKLSTEEIVVNIVLKGVGQISESDVNLASASDAIIIGFQVRPSVHAARLAEQENIEIRQYSIIYDAIAEIKSAMEGMLEPTIEKKVVGNIEVRETFKISGVGTIAGSYVLDGKISRNTKINIIRDGIVVHTGELASLKRFKDDVKEVSAGYECGLSIKGYNDIHVGDVLEGYEEIEVKRKL